MEPEVSLRLSQHPAICVYTEPDQSSPHHPSHTYKIHFIIILSKYVTQRIILQKVLRK